MNIEISTERLDADIKKMQDDLENLRNAKEQVMRCLEQLNTMWDGMANFTFRAQTNQDNIALVELMRNIDNLIECMEYAKQEYEKCHEDVNSKIASIRLSNDT